MYVCMYVCMHVCMHLYTSRHQDHNLSTMRTLRGSRMDSEVLGEYRAHVSIYSNLYIHIYTHTRTHTHTYIYIYILCVCVYIYIHILGSVVLMLKSLDINFDYPRTGFVFVFVCHSNPNPSAVRTTSHSRYPADELGLGRPLAETSASIPTLLAPSSVFLFFLFLIVNPS